jgi:hypothetical protein
MMMVFTYMKIAMRGCHKMYTLNASIQTSQKGISTKISMIISNNDSNNSNDNN